jgi:hypothetical protein
MIRSCLLAVAIAACPALAATIRVPKDQPTVQAAIDAASDGDLIDVAAGTYLETIDLLGKAVTIQGEGPCCTYIDAGGSGPAVTCASGEGPGTRILHFTIRNGVGTLDGGLTRGGGLYAPDGAPAFHNCTFDNNAADLGAGAYLADGAQARFTTCRFVANHATGEGGGLYATVGPGELNTCNFSDNTAPAGAGAVVLRDAVVRDCVFFQNAATVAAGGLRAGDGVAVLGCTVNFNTAPSAGGVEVVSVAQPVVLDETWLKGNGASVAGGALCLRGPATVSRCDFEENTCDADAGAAGVDTVSGVAFDRCRFTSNVAARGGAIGHLASLAQVTACEFSGNTATDAGGAMHAEPACDPVVSRSLFCENDPDDIAGPWSDAGGNDFPSRCPGSCPPDFNGDGVLNSLDFAAFLNAFVAGDPGADFNADGSVNSQDFAAFLNAFVAGC